MNKPMTAHEVISALSAPVPIGEPIHELEEDTSITEDGKPVPPDHPKAVMVLGGKGKKIPHGLAKRLGLALDEQPEEKAVHKDEVHDKSVHHTDSKAHSAHGK